MHLPSKTENCLNSGVALSSGYDLDKVSLLEEKAKFALGDLICSLCIFGSIISAYFECKTCFNRRT